MGKLDNLEKAKVAYYYCYGFKYSEISQALALSEATISRIINEFRKKGYIIDQPLLKLPADLEEELRAHTHESKTERELVAKYTHKGLQTAIVVPSSTQTKDSAKQVAIGAGRFLERVLAPTGKPHHVGLLWGPTLRFVAESSAPREKNPNITFVPLRGGLGLRDDNPDYSFAIECYSNSIANIMASKFGAPSPIQLTVSAFIPKSFKGDEKKLEIIWEFIESDVTYKKVFGARRRGGSRPSEALINKLNTIITGLGSAEESGAWIKWTDHIDDKEKQKLKSKYKVIGDLGCHFLSFDKNNEFVKEANKRVIGIDFDDFIEIAARHASDDNPIGAGVVLIASGERKALPIHWCLLQGAINVLVTDADTAMKTLNL